MLTGIAVLVLQVLTFLVVAPARPGVRITGVVAGFFASLVYAIVNTALTAILGVDGAARTSAT